MWLQLSMIFHTTKYEFLIVGESSLVIKFEMTFIGIIKCHIEKFDGRNTIGTVLA